MKNYLGFIVILALSSCTPMQSKTIIEPFPTNTGDRWRLIIAQNQTMILDIKKIEKKSKEFYATAVSDTEKAVGMAFAGRNEDGSINAIITLVSKSKILPSEISFDEFNNEEGTVCLAPYSADKKRIDGYFASGKFSVIATRKPATEYDGKCSIERL
jgi:hypothetical protein